MPPSEPAITAGVRGKWSLGLKPKPKPGDDAPWLDACGAWQAPMCRCRLPEAPTLWPEAIQSSSHQVTAAQAFNVQRPKCRRRRFRLRYSPSAGAVDRCGLAPRNCRTAVLSPQPQTSSCFHMPGPSFDFTPPRPSSYAAQTDQAGGLNLVQRCSALSNSDPARRIFYPRLHPHRRRPHVVNICSLVPDTLPVTCWSTTRQNRLKLPPRLSRGTVDVDQPSDARSLHPIVSSSDPSTPPTSRPSASTVRPAPNPSSPLDRPGRSAQLAPASTVNIESSTPRPDLPSGSVSQVLGRRRRPSGSSPVQDPNDLACADNEAAPAGTHSSPSRRLPKRRRRAGEDMASDGNSVLQSNGSGAARSNGSTGVASQRTVLPSGATNGTHKAASLAANGSANGDKASTSAVRPSSYFGHNREEVTRILIQALSDMGYQAAAESVSEESGFKLENPTVAAFRSAVLEGSWAEAEDLLTGATVAGQAGEDGGDGNGLVLAPGSDRNIMRFAMRQQKFLELLETRDTTRALQVLRGELTPLDHDTAKVHFLSSLLMCLSTEDLMARANWDGAGGQSRKRLLSDLSRCISPSVMLPENRLAVLLHQVKQSQINSCLFHTAASSPSLYADHHCDRRVFPRDIVLELTEMRGEVWEVQFSHDGSQLAACGSSDSVFIWETWSFQVVHALSIQVQKDHHSGVASIAWSPDDSMMVTCSQDHFARLWDTKNGQLIKKLKRFDEPVSSCIWASDSKSFVLGTLDNKRSICTFNSEGEELVQWDKKHRVQAMAGSPDGRWLVAADNFTNMYVYNGITRALEYELDLGAQPISLAISQDSRQLLVNKGDSEAQLVDLFTRATVQKFLGHMTDQCVIRASFGGANESFVMSGSEDGKVVIWHKNIGAAVERLSSFSGKRCNCVVWNPADPYMLASCNDDGKVRIWANRKRGVDIRSRIPGLTGWKHHQNEPVPF